VAYLAAEAIHTSGVLAVVACGLFLSHRSSHFFSPSVRMQAWAVWDALTFVFEWTGICANRSAIAIRARGHPRIQPPATLALRSSFQRIVIVLRMIWMFPGAYIANVIRTRLLHQTVSRPSVRQTFVVGWTGMRGVVALGAAISLPEVLADGSAFPQRNLIIFLTFSVILVTLVLQGLTLPPLIARLAWRGQQATSRKKKRREA